MKFLFKLLIGILIVSVIGSLIMVAYNFRSTNSDVDEEEDPPIVTGGGNLSGDSETPGNTVIPDDSDVPEIPVEEDIVVSGAYRMKSDIDFDPLLDLSLRLSNDYQVGFTDGSVRGNGDLEYLRFDSSGIKCDYMGSTLYLYDAVTGNGSSYFEDKTIEFIYFSKPFTIVPGSSEYAFWTWFTYCFESYTVDLGGTHTMKSSGHCFEMLGNNEYIVKNVKVSFMGSGSYTSFTGDEYLIFDSTGIRVNGNDTDYLYSASLGYGTGAYSVTLESITIDPPCEVDAFFYYWFTTYFTYP